MLHILANTHVSQGNTRAYMCKNKKSKIHILANIYVPQGSTRESMCSNQKSTIHKNREENKYNSREKHQTQGKQPREMKCRENIYKNNQKTILKTA